MRSCTKPKKTEVDSANATTDEIQDVLILVVQIQLMIGFLIMVLHFTVHHTTNDAKLCCWRSRCSLSRRWTTNGYYGYRRCANQDDEWIYMELTKYKTCSWIKEETIFVGQLDDSGHSILFSRGMWKVSKGAMVLAHEKKINTLYMTARSADIIASTEAKNQA